MRLRRRPTVEELEAILQRRDEDFIVRIKRSGELKTHMRPRWLPLSVWLVLKRFFGVPYNKPASVPGRI